MRLKGRQATILSSGGGAGGEHCSSASADSLHPRQAFPEPVSLSALCLGTGAPFLTADFGSLVLVRALRPAPLEPLRQAALTSRLMAPFGLGGVPNQFSSLAVFFWI